MVITVQKVPTTPFEGQKPGTSGLRKAVRVFEQPNYTENFVDATLTAGLGDKLKGSTLLVGGDGRYFLKEAIQIIIRIAAAKGVRLGLNSAVLVSLGSDDKIGSLPGYVQLQGSNFTTVRTFIFLVCHH